MGSIKILQRIVCYVDSFIRNLKIEKYLRPILKSLSPVEGEDTLTAIIRTIQNRNKKLTYKVPSAAN